MQTDHDLTKRGGFAGGGIIAALLLSVATILLGACNDDGACNPFEETCPGDTTTGKAAEIIHIVDSEEFGNAGYGASIVAHNADGSAGSLSYQVIQDDGLDELHLLEWVGTDFQVQKIAEGVGAYTALGRDENTGRRYIAYYATNDPDTGDRVNNLNLAQEITSGTWAVSVLDKTNDTGAFVDMAIDSSGGIHVSYIDLTTQNLKYLLWQDGAIISGPTIVDDGVTRDDECGSVTTGGGINFKTSIAITNNGDPVISYHDVTNGQLRTARFQQVSGTWDIEVIGRLRTQVAIFPDSTGVANVPSERDLVARKDQFTLYENTQELESTRFCFETDTRIRVDEHSGSAEYTVDLVESYGNDYGRWSSLAIGQSGNHLITFFDFQQGDLAVASNENPGSSPQWSFQTIDSFAVVGDFNDLVLIPQFDANGVQRGEIPVVAYFNQSQGAAQLAWRVGGEWRRSLLADQNIAGLSSTIASTPDGWVMVAFRTFRTTTAESSLNIFRVLPFRE